MTLYAGRYEKLGELGSGMSGYVYLVRDRKTGAKLALKVLKKTLKYLKMIEFETFKGEFLTLKDLNHPSIAKVFDAGKLEENEHLFIATEFVDGKNLFEATEGATVQIIEELFVQALRALNYLHSKNVIHLDIKPQNVLVIGDGVISQLKLIDFGLANFYEREFAKNRKEGKPIIVGTAAYTPPEIIEGKPRDKRADLYSLGCAFYRAFSRKLPFSGEAEEVYVKHVTETPLPPSRHNPAIPAYLDQIIIKLLEKDPSSRYSTAQAVIEDINLLSDHFYPVETPETVVSYLPEKGKLIGREKEFAVFEAFFADRLVNGAFKKKPYLLITGDEGSGKTRFLEECKNEAHRHFYKVLTWAESAKYSTDKLPTPCLVVGDDVQIDPMELEYVDLFMENTRFLAVLTAKQLNIPCPEECVITLKNFKREQTKGYLVKATGLEDIPDRILDIVFKHTRGNPACLEEYVRALFEKGFLKDSHGSWTPKILDDLGGDLEASGADEFIKKRLKATLEEARLTEVQQVLLLMLAFTGKPKLDDLAEMSQTGKVEEELGKLVGRGILMTDPESFYVFSNPLFKEVLLEETASDLKAEVCDAIADYYKQKGMPKEDVLYFQGRGTGMGAIEALHELARLQREALQYDKARESLTLLLEKRNLDETERRTVLLELGELEVEAGHHESAERALNELVKAREADQKGQTDEIFIRTLEQLGLCHKRLGKSEKARVCYEQALNAVKDNKDLRWMEIILRNRMAQDALDAGRPEEAEKIFNETWQTWKNELTDEEKIKAIRTDIDILYYLKGDYAKACGYLEEVMAVLSKKPSVEAYPITLYKLASCYERLNQADKATEMLNRCLDTLKERRTPYWLYAVYNEQGNLCDKKHASEEALTSYKHAFELAHKTAPQARLAIVSYNIANVLLKQKKFSEAQKYFVYAIKLFDACDEKGPVIVSLYTSFLGMTAVYRNLNDAQKAENFLGRAAELLQHNPLLKAYEQFLWQERADFEKSRKNETGLHEATAKLEALKKRPGFQEKEFEQWRKESTG
ncbi:MAG: tetratricopeptide repeat protein [Deltaproteobacteria bacterium]|nr:tetratricopeptide repeat protein [Deltaproteobacteria bacterium]